MLTKIPITMSGIESSRIRGHFPSLDHMLWANTATVGPFHKELANWRSQYDQGFYGGKSLVDNRMHPLYHEARSAVSRFFKAGLDDIALVPAFSFGLNLLAEAIHSNEKVLLFNGDYPSLLWPFEGRGLNIVKIDLDAHYEERVFDMVQNGEVTILACSMVNYITGHKMGSNFFKSLKDNNPDLLIIVDGTQYCGMEEFNFESSCIDILGSSAYKWLLSGYGIGFFLVKDHAKERLTLKSLGYGSGRNMGGFDGTLDFCQRMEPGHLNPLSLGSMAISLDFLSEIGMDKISDQGKRLSSTFCKRLLELGLLEDRLPPPDNRSNIINIPATEEQYDQLTKNGVVCAFRGKGIRFSWHFYNTLEEVEQVCQLIFKQGLLRKM